MKKNIANVFAVFVFLVVTLKATTTKAELFDVQFNYNATDSIPSHALGMTGIIHIGNEFWVSRTSDTIDRFDNNGSWLESFVIPGISGITAFTWDGTYIYACNNTDVIYRINPSTKAIVFPLMYTQAFQFIWCTYDPTTDNGAGGFWVGTNSGQITELDMSGNVISFIDYMAHGISGIYGAVLDTFSTGGRFLWVFAQLPPNNMTLARLRLTDGTPSGIFHDAKLDVGMSVISGTSKGMFISDALIPGKKTIGGVIQGTSDLIFGYELDDPYPVDLEVIEFKSDRGYTQIPLAHNRPVAFTGKIRNKGRDTVMYYTFIMEMKAGGNTIWTDSIEVVNIVLIPANSIFLGISSNFTPPGKGLYEVWGRIENRGTISDGDTSNNTMLFTFSVTDSTYARDDGISTGISYNNHNTVETYFGSKYELIGPDTLTSIWVRLENPVHGDTTYAIVASTNSIGDADSIIATGIPVIIDSAIHEYTLQFASYLPLAPGKYVFGCYEQANSSVGLAQSNNCHTSRTNYIHTPLFGWSVIGVRIALFIRPNFSNSAVIVSTSEQSPEIKEISLYPNPTKNHLNISTIIHSNDAIQYQIINTLGTTVTTNKVTAEDFSIDVSTLPAGIYIIHLQSGTAQTVKRWVKE